MRAHRDVVALVAAALAVAVMVFGGIGRAQAVVALLFAGVTVWASWRPESSPSSSVEP